MKALGESSALSSLRADTLKPHLAKYGPPVQTAAEALYARLNADAAKQKAKLDELLPTLSERRHPPRPGRLQQREGGLLHLPRHRLPRRQGRPRPDQGRPDPHRARPARGDRLPQRQLRPELRAGGRRHQGRQGPQRLAQERTSDEVVLATGANQEARIARDEIEEIRPGTVSVMPAGLDQQLTDQELADLVAFLKAAGRGGLKLQRFAHGLRTGRQRCPLILTRSVSEDSVGWRSPR